MDTFSHIVTGFGLAALAQADPVVADHQMLSQAVLLGTIIGSNAPDFDFLYRLKGKGSYLRHHRGYSHSLPALPLWGIAISSIIFVFFPDVSYLHLFLWTLLAVVFHVILDLFNVHGTQALLPHTKKWIAFDALPLVDPYILMLHFLGFSLIPFFMVSRTFIVIYSFIFLYIIIRLVTTISARRHLAYHFTNAKRIKLIPRTSLFLWNVVIETDEDFLFGLYTDKSLYVEHTLSKKISYPKLVQQSKQDPLVADFLAGTQYAYPFVHKRKNGYFISWKDLRFRTNKFFRNQAIQYVTSDLKEKKSFAGKLRSIKEYREVIKNMEN